MMMALFLSTLTTLARIKTVHVINSCHLDIGFADSAAGIINRYFDHHLPMAATVGAELAKGVEGFTDDKLSFMFQSWVLDLYFDCPPAMGVHCPSAEAMASVRTAIAAGHITWHAFPHNAQLEIMGEAMIDAGLELTFALDKRFGLPNKTTLSQRDVPGMPRALCVSWNRPQDQFQPSDAAPPFAATLLCHRFDPGCAGSRSSSAKGCRPSRLAPTTAARRRTCRPASSGGMQRLASHSSDSSPGPATASCRSPTRRAAWWKGWSTPSSTTGTYLFRRPKLCSRLGVF